MSAAPLEIDVAFELAMRGRLYSPEDERHARMWFCLGWIALQRKNEGLPYLVGPDDTQRKTPPADLADDDGCPND